MNTSNISLPDWLTRCAENRPEHLAVQSDQVRWSFAELDRQATRLARQLATMGVQEGHRVALLAANGLPYVAFVHALTRLGAILVPLNLRLTLEELCWQVRDMHASLLVCDENNASLVTEIGLTVPELQLATLALVRLLPLYSLAVWVTFPPALSNVRSVLMATDRQAFAIGIKRTAMLHPQFAVMLAQGLGRRRSISRVLLSDGTEPTVASQAGSLAEGALKGSPASPGIVTAQARVILDPTSARLEPGEVLVAPSTDPGWMPLFLTAGGLVMEMGGSMSHGAVVAREYGIPAVVGVPSATERITTGQRITVDGSAGTVFIEQYGTIEYESYEECGTHLRGHIPTNHSGQFAAFGRTASKSLRA